MSEEQQEQENAQEIAVEATPEEVTEEIVAADAPEAAPEEEEAPEEVAEDGQSEDEPAEKQSRGWLAAVIAVLVAVLACCTIVVCAAAAIIFFTGGSQASVTGTVNYRERIALTPDAVVQVQVQDVSLADAPATVMGEQIIYNPGQVPIPFDVAYDPDEIQENHTYALSVRIEDGNGQLLFVNTQRYAVITNGAPTENVEVWVESAGSQPPPEATAPPTQAYVSIENPVQGATVDISQPFAVSGMGAGLPEGNVVVRVLDRDGNVLIEQPTTLQGPDVGTGGEGTWAVDLSVEAEPGMAGTIYAFSPSPLDDSIVAEASVQVSLGQTAAAPTFLEMSEPAEGAVLDTDNPIQVSGTGGGLPEGNVVVWALDANDTVLAEQATTLQGQDIGTGGSGTWSVQLSVGAIPGSAGRIVAFSPSPQNDSYVASAVVNVTYGQESGGPELDGTAWVLGQQTLPDTELTADFEDGAISGSSGCNTYEGTYATSSSGGDNTILIERLSTTMMMCSPEIMEQETAYLQALESTTSYRMEENVLTMFYSGGTLLFQGATTP